MDVYFLNIFVQKFTLLQKFLWKNNFQRKEHCMSKKNFRLTKIGEKDRKDNVLLGFRLFPFHGKIIFS